VGGKDARYDVSELQVIVEAVVAVEVEVQGGRAPEVSPPGSENLGAGAVIRGEEGDDLTEDGVGEGADVVGGKSSSSSSPLRSSTARLHLR
jgi:hypothetical protein